MQLMDLALEEGTLDCYRDACEAVERALQCLLFGRYECNLWFGGPWKQLLPGCCCFWMLLVEHQSICLRHFDREFFRLIQKNDIVEARSTDATVLQTVQLIR